MTFSPDFNMRPEQSQKHHQLLMILPKMQQAFRLLQAPVMEIRELIEMELERNPLMEYAEEEGEEREERPESERELNFDENDYSLMDQLSEDFSTLYEEHGDVQSFDKRDQLAAPQESFYEHLKKQAEETFETGDELKVAEVIIGSLDEKGFLSATVSELAELAKQPTEMIERVLAEVQKFDPLGVAAFSLRESLLLQLEHKGKKESNAYRIVFECWDDLIHNHIPKIKRALGITFQEVAEALEKEIAHLDFSPGGWYMSQTEIEIIPDASIVEENGVFRVDINDEPIPRFRITKNYQKMFQTDGLDAETKKYMVSHMMSARWLFRNLEQRNLTLRRIIEFVIKNQAPFFRDSTELLAPLTYREAAEALELHESTIARSVANKYIHTPRGIFSLRHFFSHSLPKDDHNGIAKESVRDIIAEMIKNEDKSHPLRDEEISHLLLKQDIHCARRTVAKYRSMLEIGSSSQRRKYG